MFKQWSNYIMSFKHQITPNLWLTSPVSPLMTSPPWPVHSDSDLLTKHSISLMDRTPPSGSIAADILGVNYPKLPLRNTNSLMSSIKDLTETLSDFNSCNSTLESSSGWEEDTKSEAEKTTPTSRKQIKKRKRRKTPGKKEFLKKANMKVSPEKVVPYNPAK